MLDRQDVLKILELTEKINQEYKENKNNNDILPNGIPSNWNNAKSAYLDAVEKFYNYQNDKEVAVKLALAKSDKYHKLSLKDLNDELKNDKDTVLELMKNGCQATGWHECYIPDEFLSDKEFMKEAIKMELPLYMYASEEIRSDKELALEAVKIENNCRFIPHELSSQKDFMLEAVKVNSDYYLINPYNEFRNDKEITLAAVKNNPMLLKHTSNKLKADEEIVLAAIKDNSKKIDVDQFFKHCISRKLRNNAEFMTIATENIPKAYNYAFEAIKYDRDLLIAHFNNHKDSYYSDIKFYNLPETLQKNFSNDKELIISAIKVDRGWLEGASEQLKDDIDVVMPAVKHDGYALQFVSDRLKDDETVVKAAVTEDGYALEYASDRLKNDLDTVKVAFDKTPSALQNASPKIQKENLDLVYEAINSDRWFIENGLCDELKADKNFVESIIYNKVDGYDFKESDKCVMYRFASEEIKSDKNLTLDVIKLSGNLLNNIPEVLRNDKEIVEAALLHRPSYQNTRDVFRFVSDKLKDNKEFVIDMIHKTQDCYFLLDVSPRLKDDVDVFKTAKQYDDKASFYASDRIKNNPSLLEDKPMSLDEKLKLASSMRKENNVSKDTKDRDLEH